MFFAVSLALTRRTADHYVGGGYFIRNAFEDFGKVAGNAMVAEVCVVAFHAIRVEIVRPHRLKMSAKCLGEAEGKSSSAAEEVDCPEKSMANGSEAGLSV